MSKGEARKGGRVACVERAAAEPGERSRAIVHRASECIGWSSSRSSWERRRVRVVQLGQWCHGVTDERRAPWCTSVWFEG